MLPMLFDDGVWLSIMVMLMINGWDIHVHTVHELTSK